MCLFNRVIHIILGLCDDVFVCGRPDLSSLLRRRMEGGRGGLTGLSYLLRLGKIAVDLCPLTADAYISISILWLTTFSPRDVIAHDAMHTHTRPLVTGQCTHTHCTEVFLRPNFPGGSLSKFTNVDIV